MIKQSAGEATPVYLRVVPVVLVALAVRLVPGELSVLGTLILLIVLIVLIVLIALIVLVASVQLVL